MVGPDFSLCHELAVCFEPFIGVAFADIVAIKLAHALFDQLLLVDVLGVLFGGVAGVVAAPNGGEFYRGGGAGSKAWDSIIGWKDARSLPLHSSNANRSCPLAMAVPMIFCWCCGQVPDRSMV
jgi:hypothetical protein